MIKLVVVGKIKEQFFRDAIEEYKKRLSKYTKLEIIEVNDINDSNESIIIQKEKEEILKHISKNEYLISLDINGKELTSKELASKLDNLFITNSTITFIIGGSYGLHDDIKNMSNERMSFSKLTSNPKFGRGT